MKKGSHQKLETFAIVDFYIYVGKIGLKAVQQDFFGAIGRALADLQLFLEPFFGSTFNK